MAAEWSQDSCRERKRRRESARGGAGLPAPGGEQHAPAHAPPRAPKITRAGWAPTPGSGHPSQGNGAPSSGARAPPRGLRAPSPGAGAPTTREPGALPRAGVPTSGSMPGEAAGDPMRPGHADAPPEVSPPRASERRRGSPGSQLPNGRRAPALPRPPGSPRGLKRRRAGQSGSDSRGVAGVAQTPPPLLLRGAALPPTGRGDPPWSPGPTSSRPGLPLEVAAVAAGLGHRAAGTSQPSGQRPTGGSDGSWRPPAPLEPRQLPITQAPRGAATRRPRGQELGLGSPGPLRTPPAPSPTRRTRSPPTQLGTSHPDVPRWASPVGQIHVTCRNQFCSLRLPEL